MPRRQGGKGGKDQRGFKNATERGVYAASTKKIERVQIFQHL